VIAVNAECNEADKGANGKRVAAPTCCHLYNPLAMSLGEESP
jgi:hypothetical protein